MWGGVSALCLMSGVQNEEDSYKKSIAMQLHLFAWELPDTVLVSHGHSMYVCMYVWSAHIAEYGSTG